MNHVFKKFPLFIFSQNAKTEKQITVLFFLKQFTICRANMTLENEICTNFKNTFPMTKFWHHGYLWTPHELHTIFELFTAEYKTKKNLTDYLWPEFYQSYEIKLPP